MTKDSIIPRFESKYMPVTETGCWLWIGATNNMGYGQIWFRGKVALAHRVSWILKNGEIHDEMLVLHKCDIPSCVNPDHLFVGDHAYNALDSMRKGRFSGKPKKSKLTFEQKYEILTMINNGERLTSIAKKFNISPEGVGYYKRRHKPEEFLS